MKRILLLVLLASPAVASACYSVRDYDKRVACLAEERKQSAICTGIKNWDAREACRRRATR